jgi:hypothetical protein
MDKSVCVKINNKMVAFVHPEFHLLRAFINEDRSVWLCADDICKNFNANIRETVIKLPEYDYNIIKISENEKAEPLMFLSLAGVFGLLYIFVPKMACHDPLLGPEYYYEYNKVSKKLQKYKSWLLDDVLNVNLSEKNYPIFVYKND